MSNYGHELQFGVFITPSNVAAESVVALAVLADRSGLDLVTFQDHPYQPRFLDTWTLLSYVAARTSRVHLAANVINLRLREPAVLARAVASLDILSGGRVELGIGAGAFADAVASMGGRRLTPGQSVDALDEAIDVIRALWDVDGAGPASVDGRYYRLDQAARGPAPAHDAAIWVGAVKPRMLDLIGRKADGWLPSLPYLGPGALAAGNAAIDAAARSVGREPSAVRRLLNVAGRFSRTSSGRLDGPPAQWAEELAQLALEDGISTFILMADDPDAIGTFATEVAPAVREQVAAGRSGGTPIRGADPSGSAGTEDARDVGSRPVEEVSAIAIASSGSEYERLGVRPTPDDRARTGPAAPWDETTRPHRPASGPEVSYSERGRLVGQHLIDVHDALRTELGELREVLTQVRDGVRSAADARTALDGMALRQNDWTLGAFCSRYCARVAQHHGMEDDAIFPHLARREPALAPVIARLAQEHLVIGDAIERVDAALVRHIGHPTDHEPIQAAIDFLTDALVSHLSYEEHEIVEPLARHGFYAGQVEPVVPSGRAS